jgi:hypothetical protein
MATPYTHEDAKRDLLTLDVLAGEVFTVRNKLENEYAALQMKHKVMEEELAKSKARMDQMEERIINASQPIAVGYATRNDMMILLENPNSLQEVQVKCHQAINALRDLLTLV